MHLTRTYTTIAPAIIAVEPKAQPVSDAVAQETPVQTPTDGVDIKRFDAEAIPADDDGPGAGGGYKPQQDPVEGPGAGGGYDGDEIPADDDGPGAGGGYETEQEPAESDGPGAGGGYLTGSSTALTTISFWNQPLTVFSTGVQDRTPYGTTDYTPHWLQVVPADSLTWSGSTALSPMMVDAEGNVKLETQSVPARKEA
jgi:hypothetical protein